MSIDRAEVYYWMMMVDDNKANSCYIAELMLVDWLLGVADRKKINRWRRNMSDGFVTLCQYQRRRRRRLHSNNVCDDETIAPSTAASADPSLCT